LTPNTLRAISITVILTAIGGCSSQVTVNNPTIPEPLVEKIPLSVAVRYPPDFEHYIHEEKVIGKEKWTIDLGRSNQSLFTNLFRSMFNDLTVVDAFAVWIRYRIKIFDREGEQFANWPISAYGKSQSTVMGGDEALERAAVLAMRDAAALIVMQMDMSTRISRLSRPSVSSVVATV
jgi:hypothetical protein